MARADSNPLHPARIDPTKSSPSTFAETPARTGLLPLRGVALGAARRADAFELISRGDLVGGLLVRSVADDSSNARATRGDARPPALLLIAHGAGGSRLDCLSTPLAPCLDWVGEKLAVAAIDLPLHGHRASAKLSQRLVAAHTTREQGIALDTNGALLLQEFERQSVCDLRRSLDALLGLDLFDPARIGLLGLGLGARMGEAWMRDDARVGAAVLVAPGVTRRDACLSIEFEPFESSGGEEARAFLASRLGF